MLTQPDRLPWLAPGDQVAVVAPSSPVEPERLAAGLDVLKGWGLRPVIGEHVLARTRHTAGTPDQRLADLRWALHSPGFAAVWAARGGTGAVHLLEGFTRLVASAPDSRPILGFSDATCLLSALLTGGGGPVGVHAPVITSLGDRVDKETKQRVHELLFAGRGLSVEVDGSGAKAAGPLVGGNLMSLSSLCGTPYALRAAGSIVVLEDVGEPPRRIDRALSQLQQSGALTGARAVVLGTFSDDQGGVRPHWAQFAREWLDHAGIPSNMGMPVGHGAANFPFVVGELATLQ